ncbi:MAG: hypothetical protein WAN46_04565, partial [Gammaproteobacteria bacterium]
VSHGAVYAGCAAAIEALMLTLVTHQGWFPPSLRINSARFVLLVSSTKVAAMQHHVLTTARTRVYGLQRLQFCANFSLPIPPARKQG